MADLYTFTRAQVADIVELYYNRTLGFTELTAFVLGCKRLNRDLRHPLMETAVTLAGTSVPYTLPDDFMEIKSVYLTSGNTVKELRYVSYENLKSIQNKRSGGVPDVYSINANTLACGPSLADTDSIEITYYQKVDETINSEESNLYTKHFTNLLVYAMLIEAYGFIMDQEAASAYRQLYETELAAHLRQGWNQSVGSSMYVRNN